MHAYGEHNWREDLAPAITAGFPNIRWDYNGMQRRLILCGPWEKDPDAVLYRGVADG